MAASNPSAQVTAVRLQMKAQRTITLDNSLED
jgi:hypothetical protein